MPEIPHTESPLAGLLGLRPGLALFIIQRTVEDHPAHLVADAYRELWKDLGPHERGVWSACARELGAVASLTGSGNSYSGPVDYGVVLFLNFVIAAGEYPTPRSGKVAWALLLTEDERQMWRETADGYVLMYQFNQALGGIYD